MPSYRVHVCSLCGRENKNSSSYGLRWECSANPLKKYQMTQKDLCKECFDYLTELHPMFRELWDAAIAKLQKKEPPQS